MREECEERIKEHPYVGWAREETGVDVGFRHRRVGACRKHRGVQGLGACHGAKWGMDDVFQESDGASEAAALEGASDSSSE